MHTVAAPAKHKDYNVSTTPCPAKKESLLGRIIALFSSEKRSIKRGLKEAEMIHAGKRKGKSFDQFLNEI